MHFLTKQSNKKSGVLLTSTLYFTDEIDDKYNWFLTFLTEIRYYLYNIGQG